MAADQPQPVTGDPTAADLAPTAFIDAGSPQVRRLVEWATAEGSGERDVLARLFAAVRDGVRYDPYRMPVDPAEYRASHVLDAPGGYCIQKSVALTAAARAAGIPSRLGFADVKNHLQSDKLLEKMGTDLFIYHGYSTFWVDGRWVKASCAFNRELCDRFGVEALDFDGTHDALLHPFTGDGRRHMEYVHERGTYADLPLEELLAAFRETYPDMDFG